MSMTALGLVIVAAILHATWNLAAKRAGGDDRFAFITIVLSCLVWLPVSAFWGIETVLGWGWREWLVMAASAAVHVAYFNCLLTGYRRSDLTVVYPMARGSGPLIASLAAVVVLGEVLSLKSGLGITTICVGVFLLAGGLSVWRQWRASTGRTEAGMPSVLHPANPQAPSQAEAQARRWVGVRWGLLTGACIASYTVIDAYAVKVLLISPVVADVMCNVLRIPMQAPSALRDRTALVSAWRTTWKHAMVVATLGPLGYILVLTAMQRAPLAHVASARELSMLFAAWFAGKWLGEGDRRERLAGAMCMALGVAVLAW